MKTVIFGIFTVLFAVALWALGIATPVAIAAAVLKFIGVEFLSGMSYWLPVKLMGGFVLAYLGTVVCAVGTAS